MTINVITNEQKAFLSGKTSIKVKCFNEDKPIKIINIHNEDGKIHLEVYNGQADWDGEKWIFTSNFAMLSKVIMGK